MRALTLICCLASPVAFACSCGGNGATPCNFASGTDVVFLGRVIRDSGEGLGKGPARVAVEEILHGVPKDTKELEVDVMAGSSCYARLQKDERYVIFARRDPKSADLVHSGTCSLTFNLRGHELVLDGLRRAESAQPPLLIGRVLTRTGEDSWDSNGTPGLSVTAQGQGATAEAKTASDGQFEFSGLAPGDYQLSVLSPQFFLDTTPYLTYSKVSLPAHGCAYSSLYVWPNGKIAGTVRSAEGKPIEGVPVQAFAFNAKGELDTEPLRVQKTERDGRYEIPGLPPGNYVVGVNAETYGDRLAYKPLVYPGRSDRDEGERIHVGRMEIRTGIDLTLGAPREKATLIIEMVDEDGSPLSGGTANVEDPSGQQRFFLNTDLKDSTNVHSIEVYRGEVYSIRAHHFDMSPSRRARSLDGKSALVTMDGPEKTVRVVLHETRH